WNFFRMSPMSPRPTASGLMMESVRSTIMDLPLKRLFHRLADQCRRRGGANARGLERRDFFLRRALAAGDDRARMSHALARRRGLPDDEGSPWFFHVRLHPGGGFFLVAAADLADHHDRLGGGIVVEKLQHVDEADAVHGVAADADTGGLSESDARQLV